jgi:hypothetical protein
MGTILLTEMTPRVILMGVQLVYPGTGPCTQKGPVALMH